MDNTERDAARYRWLEANAYFGGSDEIDAFEYEMTISTGVSHAAHIFRNVPLPDLGELIDAKIAAEKEHAK